MKKREIVVLIIILIMLLGIVIYLINIKKDNTNLECASDKDCVPSSCCHATSCVSKGNEQECIGIRCTEVCEPGTLDCGQAYCSCINSKCEAISK